MQLTIVEQHLLDKASKALDEASACLADKQRDLALCQMLLNQSDSAVQEIQPAHQLFHSDWCEHLWQVRQRAQVNLEQAQTMCAMAMHNYQVALVEKRKWDVWAKNRLLHRKEQALLLEQRRMEIPFNRRSIWAENYPGD